MKKLLIFTPLFLLSCSAEDIFKSTVDLLANQSNSGTLSGQSFDECIDIEVFCARKNGEYVYMEPQLEILCSCNW